MILVASILWSAFNIISFLLEPSSLSFINNSVLVVSNNFNSYPLSFVHNIVGEVPFIIKLL